MNKKHIITLAGKPGSGKSTTSKLIASRLGYQHFSSGDLFRTIAKERGVNINEINRLAETEKEIDHVVDQKLRDIGQTEDNLVVDSRMAWHWMPYSFRVYLDLDLEVAAKRILSHMDPARIEAEDIPEDAEKYATVLADRLQSESKRYLDLYNKNPYNTENYDLVVDTANNSPEAVVDIICEAYNNWLLD